MRITYCVVGSRGDVQPAVGLCKALRRAGHDVLLFSHDMFEPLAREHGVEFAGIPGDPRAGLVRTAAVEMGNNPIRLVRWLREGFRPVLTELFERTLAVSEGSDLMVVSSLSLAGFHVAERLGIPAISAQLQPTTLTRAFAGALVRPAPQWLPFKSVYNRVATKFGNQTVFQMLRPLTNECRRTVLGLPPVGSGYWWNVDSPRNQIPMIYGFSPVVVPQPDDWGFYTQVTGYWFLDRPSDYRPPDELVAFLGAGPPPVYVGFGSIVDHERQEMTRIVIGAIERSGQRAVLQAGWGGIEADALPESMLMIQDVPHEWLFPHLTAAIHHGGAGTTAAALRAGLPAVIIPYYLDQFFWGWRVHELGAGPHWIPRKKLTVERLASAMQLLVHDEGIRQAAESVGRRIRAEDGTGRAVAIIERFAAEARGGPAVRV